MLNMKFGGIWDPPISLISFAHLQSAVHAAIDINSDTHSVNKNSIDAKKQFRILIPSSLI